MKVIWEDFNVKVIKEISHSFGFRYTIWDDATNEGVRFYQDDMLEICKAILDDAELDISSGLINQQSETDEVGAWELDQWAKESE